MENKIADKEINIPERRTLKQSSFLTQIEEERNRRIVEITSPRKKMSTSSFFTPNSEFTKGETHYPHALFKDNSKPYDNEGDNVITYSLSSKELDLSGSFPPKKE